MSKLLIGTSGYDYPEWKGGFYPEKLARSNFLEYYASQFNSLELNGTYYRMPTAEQMKRMIERTSGKVMFTVKAFQDLTHSTDRSSYQLLAGEFKKALEPLQVNNLLLCALFQFPESFHYEDEEKRYLDSLLKEMKDVPLVVEMRNSRWQNEQVYKALRHRNVGWCIADNPALKNLMKLEFVTTSDIAYLRFHGRNGGNWYTGDNVTRYDYLYSDEELQEFVEPIIELVHSAEQNGMQNAEIVQIFFNNHAKSQAVINAKKVEILLWNYFIDTKDNLI